jgi:hypothetical protein
MIKQLSWIVFLFFIQLNCFSQTTNDSLVSYINSAEKILLTSHQDLMQETIRKAKKGERAYYYKRFKKWGIPDMLYYEIISKLKPNKKIIEEKLILDSISKQKLIELISTQNPKEYYDSAYCFEPHHTIFILKDKKWEYIDICFGCRHYQISYGIKINQKLFLSSNEDWKKLESFFRSLNLTYKLPKPKN